MGVLMFSDILKKLEIDPKKVKLIRHSLNNKGFKACYDAGKVYEYTCHQKSNFSKGYDYWAVFLSGSGTYAIFYSLYKVGDSKPDYKKNMPKGMPKSEEKEFTGKNSIFDLVKVDGLSDIENKLTIDWGNGPLKWDQKGTTEKPIISIQPDEKKVFTGFENIVKTYDELKEIVENENVYEAWHTALSSVYAVYLIVDTETGKQYVGSAYGENGLLGRWSEYVRTRHGNNKEMRQVICQYPERYHAFQFSILQILPKTLTDEEVIHIENLWKRKLMSIEFGMNEK